MFNKFDSSLFPNELSHELSPMLKEDYLDTFTNNHQQRIFTEESFDHQPDNDINLSPLKSEPYIPDLNKEQLQSINSPIRNDIFNQPSIFENMDTMFNSNEANLPEIKYNFRLFGDWLFKESKYEISNINKIKNKFINEYSYIIDEVLYFAENIPKFLDMKMLMLKDFLFQYSRYFINIKINNSSYYQLIDVDYDTFIKKISKQFNKDMMKETLGFLFSNYQKNIYGIDKKHNYNVINYIKNNIKTENEAYGVLQLNLLDVIKIFKDDKQNGLEKLLEKMGNNVHNILKEKQKQLGKEHELLIDKKVEALCKIMKLLCSEFENYFNKKDAREKKEKK